MSPEAQRIAIAKACGWEFEGTPKTGITVIQPNGEKELGIAHSWTVALWHIPDYLSDLNAVFAFADFLASKFDVQIIRHNNSLWKVQFTEPSREYTAISESLSEAICQAGLRALKMWSDE